MFAIPMWFSTTQSRACAKAIPFPLLSGFSTRIETMSASGARPWMIPAHAVPWPTTSRASSSSTTAGSSRVRSTRRLRVSLPPTAGWPPSTPESMIATVTPLPRPASQLRGSPPAMTCSMRFRPSRRSVWNGWLQAGISLLVIVVGGAAVPWLPDWSPFAGGRSPAAVRWRDRDPPARHAA